MTFPHSEGLTFNSLVYNAFPFLCEGAGADTPPSGPPPTFRGLPVRGQDRPKHIDSFVMWRFSEASICHNRSER